MSAVSTLPAIGTEEKPVSAVDPRDVKAKLDTHVEVCALRYDGINARLKRLEWVLMTGGGTIIVLLVKLVLKVN